MDIAVGVHCSEAAVGHDDRSERTTLRRIQLVMALVLSILDIGFARADYAAEMSWIEAARARYEVPGVIVAAVRRGGPVQFYSKGLCDIDRAIPCTSEHRLAIGSVTKVITGLLAATLASERRLDLDLPAIRYWPQLRLPDDRQMRITLRDLLSQQGGLGSIDWPYFWDEALTREDYLDRLQFVPPASPFREGFAYGNANFVIAGKVIEEATGSSWETLIQERLLSPLEMRSSGFDTREALAIGYSRGVDGKYEAFPYVSPKAIHPAGGLITTAKDLSHLIAMALNEGSWEGKEVVPASAFSALFSTGSLKKRGGYALGIAYTTFRGRHVFHHLGSMGGFSAAIALLPGRWGIVVLTNLAGSSFPEGLAFGMLDRYFGGEGDETLTRLAGELPSVQVVPREARQDSPLGPSISEYEGIYGNPAWGEFVVAPSGSVLQIRFGSLDAPMRNVGNEAFSFQAAPGWEQIKIVFKRGSASEVSGFVLEDGNSKDLAFFARRRTK